MRSRTGSRVPRSPGSRDGTNGGAVQVSIPVGLLTEHGTYFYTRPKHKTKVPLMHRVTGGISGWTEEQYFPWSCGQVMGWLSISAIAHIAPAAPATNNVLQRRFHQLDTAINAWFAQANLTL